MDRSLSGKQIREPTRLDSKMTGYDSGSWMPSEEVHNQEPLIVLKDDFWILEVDA